jgi:hypothetical protein
MNMFRRHRQRGEGKAGCIFGAVLVLAAVYFAFKVLPVKIAFADIRDTATKAAEMASIKKDEDIRFDIQLKFKENAEHVQPIKDTDIEITRSSDGVLVKFEMQKQIEFIGGKVWDYREKVEARRQMF